MRMDWPSALGLGRSLAIYYGMPWRLWALRRFYRGLVAPGDLVFDIGAHVGNRSRIMAGLGAKVVALEPQPLFAAFLKATLVRRGVTLVRAAAGRAVGTATLRISRRTPTVSTLSDSWIAEVQRDAGFAKVDWDRTVEVPVTTLDALISAHGLPRFCKIDVEGLEAEILAGLSYPIPLVAVEYVPAARGIARDCIDRLTALGPYRFNLVVGETHRFGLRDWVSAETMHQMMAELPDGGRSGDIYAALSS